MSSSSSLKDQFFEKVINPYLTEVLQHPQTIEMHDGLLHIRDAEGPKGNESVETRLEAMEQARSKLGGVDTSILHHAFISIFIALWDVITYYVTILMPILSYFTRFT